jgi:hypothetical protein
MLRTSGLARSAVAATTLAGSASSHKMTFIEPEAPGGP